MLSACGKWIAGDPSCDPFSAGRTGTAPLRKSVAEFENATCGGNGIDERVVFADFHFKSTIPAHLKRSSIADAVFPDVLGFLCSWSRGR
jgi:hypothetical protein